MLKAFTLAMIFICGIVCVKHFYMGYDFYLREHTSNVLHELSLRFTPLSAVGDFDPFFSPPRSEGHQNSKSASCIFSQCVLVWLGSHFA